jgi:uncharacterized cupredoxin-like copper-binding protein
MNRISVALTAAALATACSGGRVAAPGAMRTVEIDMVDSTYQPDQLDVETGETVTFVFTNNGEVAHDAFIGDRDAQAEHEEAMRATGGHGHGADVDGAITVEPGDTGELTHTFEEPGTLEIGCHQVGHYEAGMRVAIEVRS